MDYLKWFKNKEGEWNLGKVVIVLIVVLGVASAVFGWGQ